ncbi:YIP1 family protein [Aliishimia ponticola]|uniref:YIP1 family protein n=1 Tax=Aliishimia ponticola TaxID=2499833 RepID=A0A4S4NFZ9_9RHOB|nr:YIP1 family protein [Aliishimia ponticola]THH38556.1 YIP1 family protein [Aliishimia ponticola]
MSLTWSSLFVQTLRAPADAAQTVLAQDVAPRDVYQGLVAGAAMNAVLTGTMAALFPLPPEWPAFLTSPFLYFMVMAGGLLLFVHVLTWSGRIVGGQGVLAGLLKLMVWLQFVRVALQAIGVLLLIALPPLGSLYYLVMTVLSLWIVLNFIKVGHGLSSIGGALLALFITFVGLIVALSMLLMLTGFGQMGVLPDV